MLAKIMIVRHGEGPDPAATLHGVSVNGKRSKHELAVAGWQRAGALARFFAPPCSAPRPPLTTPRALFATRASKKSKSKRAIRTLEPLAALLHVTIDDSHKLGEEKRLAAAVTAAATPVLIAWHHEHIPELAHAIAGHGVAIPGVWPDDRFDLVWVLDADDRGRWHFTQAPQLLLSGDLDMPIEPDSHR